MKRQKIIKRVYEKGREITVSGAKEKTYPKAKHPKPVSAARKAAALVSKTSLVSGPAEKKKPLRLPVDEGLPQKRHWIDDYQFPADYGLNRVRLMVKDPFWVFAYWEIPFDNLNSLKSRLSDEEIRTAKTVLRMYDVTLLDFNGTNANSYFDIEVDIYANNWYVNLYKDGVSYIAEIGLRTAGGRFISLARSNCVHTPRVSYSPRSEQIWMNVQDGSKESVFVRPSIAVSKDASISAAQYQKKGLRRIYLTDEDIRSYYSRLNPSLRDIISARLLSYFGRKGRGLNLLLEGETEKERRRTLAGLPKGYSLRRIFLGASESMVVLGPGGSEERIKQPGASELVQERIERKFFFELSTELIVYGRTESDAQVWLGDKKINLNKDGTFSLRFSLPSDGIIPLEFKAESKDKSQKRKIDTRVERRTDKEK
ncbi:MAG: DUF4912 domain-containing protein [Candidatus Omnitrophica bacterium]|nr:DUF4912 domain-containing protein [Candidatus Omnitrophota bacterium]